MKNRFCIIIVLMIILFNISCKRHVKSDISDVQINEVNPQKDTLDNELVNIQTNETILQKNTIDRDLLITLGKAEEERNEKLFDVNTIEIQYKIISGMAYRIIDQKRYLIEGIELKKYRTKNVLHYFIFDRFLGIRLENEKPGTYFFDYRGNLLTIFPEGQTYESTGVYLSENEKYIGVDGGTHTIRGMTFYSFPDGEEIGHILYRGNIYWKDDSVFYSAIKYDINIFGDGHYYIEEYNLSTGKKNTIVNHSLLKDYQLHELILYDYNTFVLRVRSVDKPEDWSDHRKINYSIELLNYNFN